MSPRTLKILWAYPLIAAALLSQTYSVRQYDCGNENQPACKLGQFERNNMRYWSDASCEADLKAEDGICKNETRRTVAKTGGWLGWALEQQRYSISQDEPINHVPWLASHNAFSSIRQGFNSPAYTNQFYSITDQLNWGVRHLELDPHHYGYAPFFFGRENANRLCHAPSTVVCSVPGYAQRLFGFAIQELRNWLDSNPGEVVIVKLDDINSAADLVRQEIDNIMGPKLYRPSFFFTGWPTMRQIRAAGKQVLFLQHNLVAPPGNNVTWNAAGLVQQNNRPVNQDLVHCIGYDGNLPDARNPSAWWDIAEGRTHLNIDSTAAGGENAYTGLLWEEGVGAATACGVSIIGLDFVNALWSSQNLSKRDWPPDDRNRASIWSWADGDFGGNAAYLPSRRRWVSRPSNQLKRLVCAPVRPEGTTTQTRDWKITAQAYAWSKLAGDAACSMEFGTQPLAYVFSFPANGLQNWQLGEKLAADGIEDEVWLGYTTGPMDLSSVSPGTLTFTMTPGGAAPQPETIRYNGPRGAQLNVRIQDGWLGFSQSSVFVPQDTGSVDVRLTVLPAAQQLAPGLYKTSVKFVTASPASEITAFIGLNIKGRTTTGLTSNSPIRFGETARFEIAIGDSSPEPVAGIVDLVRTSAPDPAAATVSVTAGSSVRVEVAGLPAGEHRFAASYRGNDYLEASESAPITVTVQPRIAVSPIAAQFTMTRGGAPPAGQRLDVSNFASGARVGPVAACDWLEASLAGSGTPATLTLTPLAAASSLGGGAHSCDFLISDSQSATGGATTLTVTMIVKTYLSVVGPNPVSLLISDQGKGRQVTIEATGNDQIPLTFTPSCPDVTLETDNPNTTTNAIVAALPGRGPGLYSCPITVSSIYAVAPVVVQTQVQVVKPTVVMTNPPGLSFIVDGGVYQGVKSFTWAPGTAHTLTTDTVQQAGTDTRYRFAGWSNGGSQTQPITAAAEGASFTLNLSAEYRLQASAAPTEGGSMGIVPLNSDHFYPAGVSVELRATPATGYYFAGWSGALTGMASPQTLVMNGPRIVSAAFAATPVTAITITSNAPGSTITVDGAQPLPLPAVLNLAQGRQYRLGAPGSVAESTGASWTFTAWDPVSPHGNFLDYVVPAAAAALKVYYRRQVLWDITANPPQGGSISGGGWQLAGGSLPIEAIPSPGYRFNGWRGDLRGATNPVTMTADRPLTAIADFAALDPPVIFASPAGQRVDGAQPGTRVVPIQLRNAGSGAAADAYITGVTNLRVVSGTGLVAAASPLPIAFGTLAAGAGAIQNLVFQWPGSATRIQFTVLFSANGGAYTGRTVLTVFR
ncbi:MAG: Ig-like domain repeat protein [Bryobacterales bacterium]|nr:Ig-like domain repeat protein [Bryobacterales bacterium]